MSAKRNIINEAPVTANDVDQYVQRAEAARKSRKAVPSVDVRGNAVIRPKQIIRDLAVGEGGVDAKMHRIFIGRDMIQQYADNGYAPVMRDGALVTNQSDVLVEVPVEFYHQSLAESKALSDLMLGNNVREDAQKSKASGVSDGEQVSVTNVGAKSLGMAAGDSVGD